VLAVVLFATAEVFGRITVVITIGLTGFTIVLLALSKVTGKISDCAGSRRRARDRGRSHLVLGGAGPTCPSRDRRRNWSERSLWPLLSPVRSCNATTLTTGTPDPNDLLFSYVGSLSHQTDRLDRLRFAVPVLRADVHQPGQLRRRDRARTSPLVRRPRVLP